MKLSMWTISIHLTILPRCRSTTSLSRELSVCKKKEALVSTDSNSLTTQLITWERIASRRPYMTPKIMNGLMTTLFIRVTITPRSYGLPTNMNNKLLSPTLIWKTNLKEVWMLSKPWTLLVTNTISITCSSTLEESGKWRKINTQLWQLQIEMSLNRKKRKKSSITITSLIPVWEMIKVLSGNPNSSSKLLRMAFAGTINWLISSE